MTDFTRPEADPSPGPATILFHSGAAQIYHIGRATLEALISDWSRARAGEIAPLQNYAASLNDWHHDGSLIIDLTAISAIHIKDVAVTKARWAQERAADPTADQAPPAVPLGWSPEHEAALIARLRQGVQTPSDRGG